jgi:GNAT superfamily N-acetyltransferase
MAGSGEVTVRAFRPSDAPAFKALNEAWISRHFALEAKDREVLDDPQGQILAKGGAVLVADDGSAPIGCCALLKTGEGFELAKMAVDPAHQGRGVGAKLMEAAIALAKARGAQRLYLESNSALQPALRLYRAHGFAPVEPKTPSPYERCNVFMERLL